MTQRHIKPIDEEYVLNVVRLALKEDIGRGDVTTELLIPRTSCIKAQVLVKQEAVVICGLDFARTVFRLLDKKVKVLSHVKDGDLVGVGTVIMTFEGPSRSILTGERVALNFISYLSSIATSARTYVEAVKPYHVDILDTRKTTPLLRQAERLAVRAGGAVNHRFNLNDMVLMKDNHRVIAHREGSLADAVRMMRQKTSLKIQVEVDDLDELKDVLAGKPDMILLDNMDIPTLKKAVRMTHHAFPVGKRPLLEASGGITLKSIHKVASTGVDRISVGALTHSRRTIDMSLEFVK
jgi:nicotinate-nucleotide pyrophosphorylase (carboxylating)